MESFVDITTTTFQAVLAVCVVFTAGYAFNGKRGGELSSTFVSVARNLLLPCLLLTTFASSSMLTWRRLLSLWPIPVIALVSHVSSLAVSLLLWRYGTTPDWIVESLTYNNVASYPLLLLLALYRISPTDNVGGLSHLEWRVMDSNKNVLERSVVYILVNFVVVELFRSLISPLMAKVVPAAHPAHKREDAVDASDTGADDPAFFEEASERTPLINVTSQDASNPPALSKGNLFRSSYLSPIFISALVGLLIGMIKPVQRAIVGVGADDSNGSWAWQSIGSGLVLLGTAFALVEMVGIGAGIRAGEKKVSPEEKIPPTLGMVLLITLWRYVAMPAIVISIVHGFRKIPSTTVFLQDPAFSFALCLSVISPPVLPNNLNPFRSYVHFSAFYLVLVTSLAVAAAVAVSGRGVSFDTDFDLMGALKSAGGGGLAGAAAMVIQVLSLMPLRTVMNYQYRYGGTIKNATMTLWNDGGLKRYYAGLGAALFQGPLSRFGDTAANAGIFALLDSLTWPVLVKTVAASFCSACFRMTLTPIDTLKTTQQTQGGVAGLKLLRERIKEKGVGSLWYGALATAAATFVGHYPWFGTYNYLSAVLPLPHTVVQKLARQAFIGFAASVVSDTVSNSLRVVKTYRQVHEGDVGYVQAAKEIIAAEGILGLFGRGLPTRLLTNGLQGLLFSILWKLFTDLIAGTGKA